MQFDERRVHRSRSKKIFSIRLPDDLRARLEKIKPDEITLAECIRQILDNYVGIERPISEMKVIITPEEIKVKNLTKKKVQTSDS